MLADQTQTRTIAPYSDERIRAKMFNNDYAPFVEGDTLYFLEQEDGIDRICRLTLIPYADMHVPYQGVRSTRAHHEFLTQLLVAVEKLHHVAAILDVRPDRAYQLLARYEVDMDRFRIPTKPDPVPFDLDFKSFKHDYEIEAYSTRELETKYDLSRHRIYKIIDLRDLVEPTDQVKMIKRYERNPEYRNVRGRGIPRPNKGRLEEALKDKRATLDSLGDKFGVSRLTVREWLNHYELKTVRMSSYDRHLDVETSLVDLVYDEVIVRGRPLETVANEQGVSRTTVWRIASSFGEWDSVKGSLRMDQTSYLELRRVYHAVQEKRMTKKQACRVLKVSYNTLIKRFGVFEKKGAKVHGGSS